MSILFSNQGFCNCCGQQVTFSAYGEWLRDLYLCNNCGSLPRQRNLQYVLNTYFAGWNDSKIHETSPSNNYIQSVAPLYSSSQYLPEIVPGSQSPDGVRSENMESMSFADNTFEIFISQDVLEHVFHPRQAILETLRVLAPGGIHIFTAPMFSSIEKSIRRAELLETGEIRHLAPPEYHGNPVGDGKALVTWLYGKDFPFLLSEWSNAPVGIFKTKDRTLGIDSEIDEVFVIKKPI